MPDNTTVTEAINDLRSQGYIEDFNLKQNCIECRSGEYKIFHNEFVIDSYQRFDDNTDPGDEAILYAISSNKYNIKGILLNAYGVYSEALSNEMLQSLRVK